MQYIRSTRAPFALLALSATIACSTGDDNRADSALATDTALNRDINLAGADTAAQPALTDVPAATTPTPAATRPAASRPTTSASRPSTTTSRPSTTTSRPATSSSGSSASGASTAGTATINAGYTVNARADRKVCSNTINVGDTFTATVYESTGTGTGSIPAGATVTLRVTQVSRGENVRDDAVLATDVQSITINGRTYTPSATVTYANVDQERASSKGNDAKKVIGGAVIGAVAGQVLGKDTRSTVTGAAAGAAAGTAAAVATANRNGCINTGARITFRIDESMTVRS